jgi:hypothetical protein
VKLIDWSGRVLVCVVIVGAVFVCGVQMGLHQKPRTVSVMRWIPPPKNAIDLRYTADAYVMAKCVGTPVPEDASK